MGFMDKMKAANGLNFGEVESPDFPSGMLIMKDKKLCIIPGAMNINWPEHYVEQSNIECFKLMGCGGSWAKYYIRFKDGKRAVITQPVFTQSEKQSQGVSMAPLERFLFVDEPSSSTGPMPVQGPSSKPADVASIEPPLEPASAEKKVCPKCGASIDDEMLFCGECGERLK